MNTYKDAELTTKAKYWLNQQSPNTELESHPNPSREKKYIIPSYEPRVNKQTPLNVYSLPNGKEIREFVQVPSFFYNGYYNERDSNSKPIDLLALEDEEGNPIPDNLWLEEDMEVFNYLNLWRSEGSRPNLSIIPESVQLILEHLAPSKVTVEKVNTLQEALSTNNYQDLIWVEMELLGKYLEAFDNLIYHLEIKDEDLLIFNGDGSKYFIVPKSGWYFV